MSSQRATHDQEASPYITPIVNFTAFSLDTWRQPAAQKSSTGASLLKLFTPQRLLHNEIVTPFTKVNGRNTCGLLMKLYYRFPEKGPKSSNVRFE